MGLHAHLASQPVLILGLGASGLAMARWCTRQGAQVCVADTRSDPPQLAALQRDCPDAEFIGGAFSAELLERSPVRAVFRSPGLAPAVIAPVWQAAHQRGLWCGTELSLFAQALRELQAERGYAPKVLAVTGTNGKTTVTALTGQLVARAGFSVAVAGNIGPSLLDTLDAHLSAHPNERTDERHGAQLSAQASEQLSAPPDAASSTAANARPAADAASEARSDTAPGLPQVWVLELSSFQLDGVDDFEPTAAVVLNLTQDHLDWHGDMQAYGAAKARIFGAHGLMVLNRDAAAVMAMLPPPQRVKLQRPQQRAHLQFGDGLPQRPGDFGLETVNGMSWLVRALPADEALQRRRDEAAELHIQRLMPADALRIRGRHNALNALAALALAGAAGCALAPVLYGLREYPGEPHRVACVALLGEVSYIDDSKGTNVGATVAALEGLGATQRIVVILGGDGKGQDFTPLAAPVARHARAVQLIGRDAGRIRAALAGCGVPLQDAASLEAAVQQAAAQAQAGDAVLLSPACASLDMFDNYEHRARVFVQAVAALAQEQGQTLEGLA